MVVLPYKDDVKEGSTYILESVPCEYDEGNKKSVRGMDDGSLPL